MKSDKLVTCFVFVGGSNETTWTSRTARRAGKQLTWMIHTVHVLCCWVEIELLCVIQQGPKGETGMKGILGGFGKQGEQASAM